MVFVSCTALSSKCRIYYGRPFSRMAVGFMNMLLWMVDFAFFYFPFLGALGSALCIGCLLLALTPTVLDSTVNSASWMEQVSLFFEAFFSLFVTSGSGV